MATQFSLFVLRFSPFLIFWSLLLLKPSAFVPMFPWLLEHRIPVLIYSPLILVATLGVYAITVVLYGVATFNDCKRARDELVAEIVEAKADLRRRGIFANDDE